MQPPRVSQQHQGNGVAGHEEQRQEKSQACNAPDERREEGNDACARGDPEHCHHGANIGPPGDAGAQVVRVPQRRTREAPVHNDRYPDDLREPVEEQEDYHGDYASHAQDGHVSEQSCEGEGELVAETDDTAEGDGQPEQDDENVSVGRGGGVVHKLSQEGCRSNLRGVGGEGLQCLVQCPSATLSRTC